MEIRLNSTLRTGCARTGCVLTASCENAVEAFRGREITQAIAKAGLVGYPAVLPTVSRGYYFSKWGSSDMNTNEGHLSPQSTRVRLDHQDMSVRMLAGPVRPDRLANHHTSSLFLALM
jgi:hypothetical protein